MTDKPTFDFGLLYPKKPDDSVVQAYTDFAIMCFNQKAAEMNEDAPSPIVLPLKNPGWDRTCMLYAIAEVFGFIANALEYEHELDLKNIWIRNSSYIG